MNRRDLEKHLREHGCAPHRQGGKHEIWINPATGRKSPVPRHTTVKRSIVRSACRKLGIPVPAGY
jgi:mRNA interferase HicA